MLEASEIFPDIIVLSETWLTSENVDSAHIEGYSEIHTIRPTNSGGISIFYRNHLCIEKITSMSLCNSSIESCAVTVTMPDSTIYYIIGIYRPHSGFY